MLGSTWAASQRITGIAALAVLLAVSLANCSVTPKPPHATIYLSTQGHAIAAVDAATGAVRWTFQGGEMMQIAQSGDVIYAAGTGGAVYALAARTGHVRWRRQLEQQPFPALLAVVGGVLYFTGDLYPSNQITHSRAYALDAGTGATRWQVDLPGFAYLGGSATAQRLYLTVTSGDTGAGPSAVYALRLSDGMTDWSRAIPAGIRSALTVDTHQVYVASEDGAVQALGANDGALHWRRVVTAAGTLMSTPVSDGATVYVGDYRSNILALRAGDGTKQWTRNFPNSATDPGERFYTPSLAAGGLYLSSIFVSNIYALRPGDGSTLWSYDTLGYSSGPPVVTQAAIYAVSGPYTVDILDARTGAALASYSFPKHQDLTGLMGLVVGPPL